MDWTGGDYDNPNEDVLTLVFGLDFTCCSDSTFLIDFHTIDNHWTQAFLGDTCYTEITVVDVFREPDLAEQGEPYYVTKCDTFSWQLEYTDPDLCDTIPTHMTFSFDDADLYSMGDSLDFEAWIDEDLGIFYFHAGPHFVPPRTHDMSWTIVFTVEDHSGLTDSETYTFIIDEPEFILR
jgi:hypothetical protein